MGFRPANGGAGLPTAWRCLVPSSAGGPMGAHAPMGRRASSFPAGRRQTRGGGGLVGYGLNTDCDNAREPVNKSRSPSAPLFAGGTGAAPMGRQSVARRRFRSPPAAGCLSGGLKGCAGSVASQAAPIKARGARFGRRQTSDEQRRVARPWGATRRAGSVFPRTALLPAHVTLATPRPLHLARRKKGSRQGQPR